MPHSIRPGRYVDSVIRIFRGGALADGRQAVLPSSCHPDRQRRLPAIECGCPATRAAARAHRGQLRHIRLLGKPVISGIRRGRSALPVATRRFWPTMLLYLFVVRHHCPLRPEAKFVSHHRGQDSGRAAHIVRLRPAACARGRCDRHSVGHSPSPGRRGDHLLANYLRCGRRESVMQLTSQAGSQFVLYGCPFPWARSISVHSSIVKLMIGVTGRSAIEISMKLSSSWEGPPILRCRGSVVFRRWSRTWEYSSGVRYLR